MPTKKPHLSIDILTVLPDSLHSYLNSSILGRAQGQKLVRIKTHDLRKWAMNEYGSVDDKPFGGGPGMVLAVEPIDKALKALKVSRKKKSERIIVLSAKGKQFTAQEAQRLASYKRLVFICGRYEGIDERVAENLAHEELSIGPFVLTGGELPAAVITDAVTRLIPGVLGKAASLEDESHNTPGEVEAPQYTRPAVYKKKWKVPAVLLSGDHKKITTWKNEFKKKKSP